MTISKTQPSHEKASNGPEEHPVAGNTKPQHPHASQPPATQMPKITTSHQGHHTSPTPRTMVKRGPHVTTHTQKDLFLSSTISAAHPRVSHATLIRPQTSPRAHVDTPIRELLRPPSFAFRALSLGD